MDISRAIAFLDTMQDRIQSASFVFHRVFRGISRLMSAKCEGALNAKLMKRKANAHMKIISSRRTSLSLAITNNDGKPPR